MRAVVLILLASSMESVISRAQNVDDPLKRLSAEADRFAEDAPRFVGTESLRQTASTGTHEVVSEYGFMDLPTGVREVRRVTSVDGKAAKPPKKMDSLGLAAASDSDTDRRKMLELFEKHGLKGVATDFGQLILLFAHGNMQKFEFSAAQKGLVGTNTYLLMRFQQLDGSETLTIFEGDKPVKQKLNGEVWFREPDGRPVRIALDSVHEEKGVQVRDIGTVDYEPGPSGSLLPAAVVHRQFRNGRLHVQDAFRYTDYRETAPPSRR